jgi:hypothetical protein
MPDPLDLPHADPAATPNPIDSGEPHSQHLSSGAARTARHRERRRRGLRCLTIDLRKSEIDALVRRGRLALESRGDIPAIRKALHEFLDDALR